MDRERMVETFKSLAAIRRVLRDPEVTELPMEFREAVATVLECYEGMMARINEHFNRLDAK